MSDRIPWYKRVKRWGQTNLTEDDPERNNIDFWREQWKRTKIQGVIINCGGIVAYYPSKFGLQYRAATLGDRDYYEEWSKAAREEGLAVIARMDINRATEEFYQAHPDWFSVDKDGKPYTTQGRYLSCVNSGYYKEYIPAVLTEIIEKYHPEGFADNSWKGLGRNQICYCENCKRLFKEKTGLDLPEKPDFEDSVYRKWVRWNYDCRTENWDLFNATTQRIGGEDCLWFGMIHADPANADGAFVDMKALLDRSKYIFTDHQSRDLLNGFEQNHENGELLRMAAEENVIVPESLANYVRGDRTFRLAANPYEETRMWSLSGCAGGISPWYHHIGGGTRDSRQFETPVPFFSWHEENEEYLYDRTSLANVAVLWNQANSVFYGRDQVKERVSLPWRGMLAALHEERIPFLPVHVDDIDRYADRFNTLILPDVAVLSDAQIDAVLAAAARGTNLVITGNTGGLDEEGEPRTENRLLKALGITLTGSHQGSFMSQSSNWEYPLAHTYLHVGDNVEKMDEKDAVSEILAGFENTEIIGFGGGLYDAVSDGPLRPIGGYVKPFPIYPPEFSWVREIDDSIHPIFAGMLESGAKVVYFAADIDRCYGRNRLPDHRLLLANAVRYAMTADLPVHVEGNGYIDLSIYEQNIAKTEDLCTKTDSFCGKRRILHMNNLSGADVFGYCHRILPVYDFTVTMPANGNDTAHIKYLVSGKCAEIAAVDDEFVIPVEKIEDHEVLVIE